MPSDITGTDIVQEDPESGRRQLEFLQGPVFANIILADEINRTPPKTQAAMLQTMQEREVGVGRETYALPSPFLFSPRATRSSRRVRTSCRRRPRTGSCCRSGVNYPTVDEEIGVVSETTGVDSPELSPVLSGADVLQIRRLVRAMPVSQDVIRYAVLLATRVARRAGRRPTPSVSTSGSVPGLVRRNTSSSGPRAGPLSRVIRA